MEAGTISTLGALFKIPPLSISFWEHPYLPQECDKIYPPASLSGHYKGAPG